MQEKNLKEKIDNLLQEMVKKKLTEQQKIDIIFPVIEQNPEIININSGNERYNKANIIFNSLMFCPSLFDKIKGDDRFEIDYTQLNKNNESLLLPVIVHQPHLYHEIKNKMKIETILNIQSERSRQSSFDNKYIDNLLETALINDKLDIAQDLINSGADIHNINTREYGSLVKSIVSGKPDTLEFILKNGINPNIKLDNFYYYSEGESINLSDLFISDILKYKFESEKQRLIEASLKNMEILHKYGYDFSVLEKYSKADFIAKFSHIEFYNKFKEYGFQLPQSEKEDFLAFSQLYKFNAQEMQNLEAFDVNLESKVEGYGIFSLLTSRATSTSGYMGASLKSEIEGLHYLLDNNIFPFNTAYKDKHSHDFRESEFLIDMINGEDTLSILTTDNASPFNTFKTLVNFLTVAPGHGAFSHEESPYTTEDILSLAQYLEKFITRFISLYPTGTNVSSINETDIHIIDNLENVNTKLRKCAKEHNQPEFVNIARNIYRAAFDSSIFIDMTDLPDIEEDNLLIHDYTLSSRTKAEDWFKRIIRLQIYGSKFEDNEFSLSIRDKNIFDSICFSNEELINIYTDMVKKFSGRGTTLHSVQEGVEFLKTKISLIEKELLNDNFNTSTSIHKKLNRI